MSEETRPTTIAQIPDELLVEIFQYVGDDDRPEAWRDLVRQTHVCRDWRILSLASPTLWTHIRLGKMPISAAKAFLARTAAAPIHVSVLNERFGHGIFAEMHEAFAEREARTREDALTLLSPITHRIAYLRLQHLHGASGESSFVNFFSRSFPALEALDISEPYLSKSVWPKLRVAPRLKHMHISSASYDGLWDTETFTRLVSLKLDDLEPSTCLSVPDLASTLSICSRLERLILFQDFSAAGPGLDTITIPPIPEHSQVNHLQSLKHLEIKGGQFIPALDFLSHLRFPVLERLFVDVTVPTSLTEHAWKAFHSSERTPFGILSGRSRCFSVQMAGWGMSVSDYPTLICLRGHVPPANYELSLQAPYDSQSPDLPHPSVVAVEGFLAETSGCPHIDTLYLGIQGSGNCTALARDILTLTPYLVALHICNPVSRTLPGLVRVVCEVLFSSHDLPPLLLPSLQHMVIHFIDISDAEDIDAPLNALVATLAARKARGASLQTLTIRVMAEWRRSARRPDSDKFVARFESLVKRVEWYTT